MRGDFADNEDDLNEGITPTMNDCHAYKSKQTPSRPRLAGIALLLAVCTTCGEIAAQEAGLEFAPDSMSAGTTSTGATEPATSNVKVPSLAKLIAGDESWSWQTLPDGLIYHSYLAGTKEARFASEWTNDRQLGNIWDVSLGGRVGLCRYGTEDSRRPEGWQMDMEGAAFPRLSLDESLDVMTTDFRFGLPLTYGSGSYQMKLAGYHLCSHLGDEWILKHPEVERINYSRNALVWGNSYYWNQDLRLYGEAGWAFYTDGGARPWEFQFGVDYSPARPTGPRPVPFVAVNSTVREDVGYAGNMALQTGYQWRGETNHLFRAGVHYFVGKSDQYEVFQRNEDKVGLGLWYDF